METEWSLNKIPGYKLSGNNLGISSVSTLSFLIRDHNQNLVTKICKTDDKIYFLTFSHLHKTHTLVNKFLTFVAHFPSFKI